MLDVYIKCMRVSVWVAKIHSAIRFLYVENIRTIYTTITKMAISGYFRMYNSFRIFYISIPNRYKQKPTKGQRQFHVCSMYSAAIFDVDYALSSLKHRFFFGRDSICARSLAFILLHIEQSPFFPLITSVAGNRDVIVALRPNRKLWECGTTIIAPKYIWKLRTNENLFSLYSVLYSKMNLKLDTEKKWKR